MFHSDLYILGECEYEFTVIHLKPEDFFSHPKLSSMCVWLYFGADCENTKKNHRCSLNPRLFNKNGRATVVIRVYTLQCTYLYDLVYSIYIYVTYV